MKQETLEEVAEGLVKSHPDFKAEGMSEYQNGRFNGIIEGANWAIERMYSEEDMTDYALYILHNNVITPKEWVKQFKKK